MNTFEINQAYLFLLFTINGALIGFLFDVFRILRKSFKTCDTITYIQDIIFWITSGILTLYFIFIFSNGEIRLYMFIGIILGSIIYLLTISRFFIKISVKIIQILKTVLR
ncbi:MAG: spore cortex biosynthesis protein YabQ [Clostridia bacterium]|jgi:spore cortex biosynthesis protein YabQ|nr:spore cortex biosynthesis protein YabQ [Clostridia bacterium]